jgi:hypothetical protein
MRYRGRGEHSVNDLEWMVEDLNSSLDNYRQMVRNNTIQKEVFDNLNGALRLALYYVEGDATYDGVIEKIKTNFGIDLKRPG